MSTPKGHQIWSTSTLERLLRNTVYIGTLYYNRRVILPEAARVPRHAPGHQTIAQLRPREEWIGVAVPPVIDDATWPAPKPGTCPTPASAPATSPPSATCCATSYAAVNAAGPAGKRPENGARLHRLLLLPPRPAHAPARTKAALHATFCPLRRARPARVGRGHRHLQRPDLILKACGAPSQEPLAHQDRQLTELRGQQRRLIDAYQSGAISLTELEARRRLLDDRVGELEQLHAPSTTGAIPRRSSNIS